MSKSIATPTIDRLKGFDVDKVLELCRDFLGGAWANVTKQTFRYKPLEQGMGNRLIICELADDSTDVDESSPRKVLVRLLGGNFLPRDAPIRTLDETGETLVFYALGAAKIGPQLYGVFPGGRIEEFIESRTLTLPEWLTDASVNREIAVIAGKLHCLTIPISKKPWDLVEKVQSELQKFNQVKQTFQKEGYLSHPMAVALQQFDFASEIQFVKSVLLKLKQRVVFGTNDMNRSNFLRLKDNETGQDTADCKIMAIDYEFSSYNYRGYDLGNYLGMKVFDFGSEDIMTGAKHPDDTYERSFVEKYVETIRESPNKPADWDESGLDSVDHILMEIDFGCFAIRMLNLAWLLRDLDKFLKMGEAKKPNKPQEGKTDEMSEPFSEYYQQRKRDFLIKYPQFTA